MYRDRWLCVWPDDVNTWFAVSLLPVGKPCLRESWVAENQRRQCELGDEEEKNERKASVPAATDRSARSQTSIRPLHDILRRSPGELCLADVSKTYLG